MGIMVEYLVEQLGTLLPNFDLDPEEFAEFRKRRFEEMQNEAKAIEEARAKAVAEQAQNQADFPDLDLDEIDDGDIKPNG